ncbi:MAG: hypothetical protein IK127_05045 [Clostridia bacterium]|nr:hypothetical protein [Clostridia bacterium]
MKKLLALLLAIMMVLASVSVLAEGEAPAEGGSGGEAASPTGPDGPGGGGSGGSGSGGSPGGPSDEPALIVTGLGQLGNEYFQTISEKINNGENPLANTFSEDTVKAVTEVVGENPVVHDMFGVAIGPGYQEGMPGYTLVPDPFNTEYKAGEPISAILVLGDGTEYVLEASVPEDFQVSINFTGDQLAAIAAADEAFVTLVNAQ